MIVLIKWSKTIQFSQRKLELPMIQDVESTICPVTWLLYMIQQIPADPKHNLFCYPDETGNMVPVTYKDLTTKLRYWLACIGEQDTHKYSSHSLRRGGTTHAFNNDLPGQTIQMLGDWASQCYRRYIDLTVESRIKAWTLFSHS